MTTTSYDPRTGNVNDTLGDTSDAELREVLRTAAIAAPAVAGTAPRQRQTWLYSLAAALEAHAGDLVDVADREPALGQVRLSGEVARASDQLRFYGDVAAEGSFLDATLDRAGATSPALGRTGRPLGPVAVFCASNFPFAFGVLGHDTGSAIAAGCPAIANAHPAHPLLSAMLGMIAREALSREGAPKGTFTLVAGFDTGLALVTCGEVAAVAFTGSQTGGMALWRLANGREEVIPVFAEMGTVNPVVVTHGAGARIADIACGFVESFTLGAGQYCTKPGLLLAPRETHAAAAVAAALDVAAPSPVMLTASMAAAVRAGIADLTAAGATTVGACGGDGEGWTAPTVVLSAAASAFIRGTRLLEECFGPVVLVVEYGDQEELDSVLSCLRGSLAASIFMGEETDPDAERLLNVLSRRVGRVVVDGCRLASWRVGRNSMAGRGRRRRSPRPRRWAQLLSAGLSDRSPIRVCPRTCSHPRSRLRIPGGFRDGSTASWCR